MTVFNHELKRSAIPFIVWSAIVAGMMFISVMIYPEMASQMNELNDMFASMGNFTAAFGMDKVNFGTPIGYYSTECGNVLGIGGAFFAAYIAISSLSKEENQHTAEFLLTHPISRISVIFQKFAALLTQILLFNIICTLTGMIGFLIIGEEIDWKIFILIHLSFFILQIELVLICFGLSAFFNRGEIGVGLGIAALMYFLNIISNITDGTEFLKYVTPFKYTETSSIINEGNLDWKLVAIGLSVGLIFSFAGMIHYQRKDISA